MDCVTTYATAKVANWSITEPACFSFGDLPRRRLLQRSIGHPPQTVAEFFVGFLLPLRRRQNHRRPGLSQRLMQISYFGNRDVLIGVLADQRLEFLQLIFARLQFGKFCHAVFQVSFVFAVETISRTTWADYSRTREW